MASLVGKKQGGRTYYYLVESARVGGKPRIVSQRYLGSAEEVAARLSESGPGEADRSRHLAFEKWWGTTAGDRWLRIPGGALDHRRFWDAMDVIEEDDLKEIEARIVAQMVETFAIDLSGLVLDMTNFATWIDSGNDRAPIAERGHSKRRGTTCASVASDSWCLSTGASLSSATPIRETSPTSPSSGQW